MAVFMNRSARVVAGTVTMSEAMAAARPGEDAVEAAVRQHSRLVYRIAYSVLRNSADAEDATQETFLRVLRSRRKLEEIEDPKAWLARIAWRVAVDRRRKQPESPLDEAVIDTLRSTLAGAEELAVRGEMLGILDRLMQGLQPPLREAMVLSTVEEMSTTDVARVLEVTEAVVRSRLFRGRQVLREKLAALLEGKHGT
jgi:RNA polymerase sigma-70 factor (ECF subfamily)